jgi:hypothetical protein
MYIQNPSYADIRLLFHRKPTELAGHGSETPQFFLELMKQQGFDEESEWLEHRLHEIEEQGSETGSKINGSKGWWMYYSRPQEVSFQSDCVWLLVKSGEHRINRFGETD